MKHPLLIASGILLAGSAWLALTSTGLLGVGSTRIAEFLPAWMMLGVTIAIPVLGATCSLRLPIHPGTRIVSLILLLICVPLLPSAYARFPATVIIVAAVFLIEEIGIIPFVNQRWLSDKPKLDTARQAAES